MGLLKFFQELLIFIISFFERINMKFITRLRPISISLLLFLLFFVVIFSGCSSKDLSRSKAESLIIESAEFKYPLVEVDIIFSLVILLVIFQNGLQIRLLLKFLQKERAMLMCVLVIVSNRVGNIYKLKTMR